MTRIWYPGTTSFLLCLVLFTLKSNSFDYCINHPSVKVQQTEDIKVLNSLMCVWQGLSFRKLLAVGEHGKLGLWACQIGLVNWWKNHSLWIKVVKPIFVCQTFLLYWLPGEADCVLLLTAWVRQIMCSYWLPGETDYALLLTARVRQIVCSYWLPGWDKLCAPIDCQGETDYVLLLTARSYDQKISDSLLYYVIYMLYLS